MMNNPVTKISRPDFTDSRIGHHKGQAAPDPVIAVLQFPKKSHQISFKVSIKTKLVDRIAFVPPAIEIGVKNGIDRQFRKRCARGRSSISGHSERGRPPSDSGHASGVSDGWQREGGLVQRGSLPCFQSPPNKNLSLLFMITARSGRL